MKDRTTVLSIMRVSIGVTYRPKVCDRLWCTDFGNRYGTVDVAMDMLNKCVSGLQQNGDPSLKNYAGRPSAPGAVDRSLSSI